MTDKKTKALSKEERVLKENSIWLQERWEKARKEYESGEVISVPYWFFDKVTDRQIQKIKEIGLDYNSSSLTKGEASDIIGLFEPIEDEQEEILKFFKVSLNGMNKLRASYEIEKLFSLKDNFDSWKNREASPMQKEFYRFFDLKVPKGLTHVEASNYIREYSSKISEEDESKFNEWDEYESIYDDIDDPDFREAYEIKKVSLSLYRSAIIELKKEGYSLSNLNDDIDIVIQKIIELKPEIQKR
ncbi:MAG: hypothetical protein JW870_13430 [Candidatus Delongbacteria bacterium]|nr:hypothetical protein [Candidatus Delongbacteria bacterium]